MRDCIIWCPRMSPQMLSSPWPVPPFIKRSLLRVSAEICISGHCQSLLGQPATTVDLHRHLTYLIICFIKHCMCLCIGALMDIPVSVVK